MGAFGVILAGTAWAEIGAPTNLSLSSYSAESRAISLLWNDNSNNEIRFDIELSSDGGATWSKLGASASGTTTFYGTVPASEKLLFFRVVATDGTDVSVPSNLISLEGTNPEASDTDGDGMADAFEVLSGLDPYVDDSYEDADGDRYPNIFEYAGGSDATDSESVPEANFIVDGTATASGNIHPTLQAALDHVDGDYQVILIREGVYSGTGNVGLTLPASHSILLIGRKGAGTSVLDGGGAARLLTVEGNAVIDGLTFKNGRAGEGGALYFASGDSLLVNCVFLGNHAEQKGAAIYQKAGSLLVIHSTFSGNSVAEGGTAVHGEAGEISVLKSILWDADATAEISRDAGTVEVADSIVRGGFAGQGNLAEDPLLESDGRLKAGSPAIDKGGILQTAMRDMDGELRPVGVTTDIGADEWHSPLSEEGESNEVQPVGEDGMPGSGNNEDDAGPSENAPAESGNVPPAPGTTNGTGSEGNEAEGGRVIYVNSAIGDDSKDGLQPTRTGNDAPKQTVTGAIEEARAGDTIVLDGGVYREAINFNFPGEGKVIISASEPVILGMDPVQ